MIVTGLQAENIKRLKAVSLKLDPEGGLVIIGGENEAGKSTALDSITYALEGKGSLPPEPIRHGETSGEIMLNLEGNGDDPLVVTRTFTKTDSYLKVTTPEGAELKSPQKLLDSFRGRFVDPLGFVQADSKEQVQVLKDLTKLDFTELEADRQAAYEERTVVNRDIKAAEARIKGMTHHDDVTAPLNVEDMMNSRKLLEEHDLERTEKEKEIEKARTVIYGHNESIELTKNHIEKLENQVAALYKDLNEVRDANRAGEESLAKLRIEYEKMDPKSDFTDMDVKIAGASEHNRKFNENQRRKAEAEELAGQQNNADALTAAIDTYDQKKLDMIAQADMPVDGLAFGEGGVMFNGIPFEQCSQAQKLKISAAIGLATNPKLRVLLIHDGSLLDENSMKLMAQIAQESEAKIFLERVGDADENAIIIEDGRVKQ